MIVIDSIIHNFITYLHLLPTYRKKSNIPGINIVIIIPLQIHEKNTQS